MGREEGGAFLELHISFNVGEVKGKKKQRQAWEVIKGGCLKGLLSCLQGGTGG